MEALQDSDFDAQGRLTKFPSGAAIVLVHANFCGHCRNFKPMMEAAADKLNGVANFGHVQLESSRHLVNRLSDELLPSKIGGFPAVLGYRDGLFVATHAYRAQGLEKEVEFLSQFADYLRSL